MRYLPSVLVCVVRRKPVSWFQAVTAAPRIAESEASRTLPASEAWVWAAAGRANASSASASRVMARPSTAVCARRTASASCWSNSACDVVEPRGGPASAELSRESSACTEVKACSAACCHMEVVAEGAGARESSGASNPASWLKRAFISRA